MELKCPNGHGEMPVTSETWAWADDPHANTTYTIIRVCHTCAISTYEDHCVFLRNVRKGTQLPQPEVVVGVDSLTPWPEEDGDELTVSKGDDLGD